MTNGQITGTIFNIQRFSLHDGPGIRTTVFLKGCPLDCRWCQNPEGLLDRPELLFYADRCIGCGACAPPCPVHAITFRQHKAVIGSACTHCGACVEACPTKALEMSGERMTVEQVMKIAERDAAFYEESGGGITLSGGEPLEQFEFAAELLRACKERGFHTAIDTSGFAEAEAFDAVLPFTDLFLFDLKHIDDEAHKRYTDVSNQPIFKNLKRLRLADCEVIVRYPLVPGINDTPETARRIAELVEAQGITKLQLLPHHTYARGKEERLVRARERHGIPAQNDANVKEIAALLADYNFELTIGG